MGLQESHCIHLNRKTAWLAIHGLNAIGLLFCPLLPWSSLALTGSFSSCILCSSFANCIVKNFFKIDMIGTLGPYVSSHKRNSIPDKGWRMSSPPPSAHLGLVPCVLPGSTTGGAGWLSMGADARCSHSTVTLTRVLAHHLLQLRLIPLWGVLISVFTHHLSLQKY